MSVSTTTHQITTDAGTCPVTVSDQGEGRPFLLLHGGAGPQSVAAFAALLAGTRPARVLTVTHPGFGGTPRPDHLSSVRALAAVSTALLDELEVSGITVVGNSLGGWVAAEMALTTSPRIGGVVLVDAVGLDLPAAPIVDFFSLTMDQVTELSYHQPERHRVDVAGLSDAARTVVAGNRGALLAYGGTTMADPTLLERVSAVALPTLVVWGAADRVVPPEHGHAYAAAIPHATLDIIDTAGHLPQIETPDRLLTDVWAFTEQLASQGQRSDSSPSA